MYTNADITVYNFYNGAWYRSIVYNVFLNNVKKANLTTSGSNLTDSTTIYIPLSSCKDYVGPLAYTGTGFTLVANNKDFIIQGAITTDIVNTSEATISTSLKSLVSTYGALKTINIVDGKLFGSQSMQHFVVSCK